MCGDKGPGVGTLISGGDICFGLQVEIRGPPDGIFRGTEYYVTGHARGRAQQR